MKDAYWIGSPEEARLAIVPRPRGADWLEDDLLRLRRAGIDVVVSMLMGEESLELGLEFEKELAEKVGLVYFSYPMLDRSTPSDLSGFRSFVGELAEATGHGQNVGVHCRGCIGRATVLTASVLIARGWPAERALREIELTRGCVVPDTLEQRRWIESFAF
jgi:protein-tyrosine phosphatase